MKKISNGVKKQKLPKDFKPLLWSYKFSEIDPERDKQTIIVNVVNYGNWRQWQWIIKTYGRKEVKRLLVNTPMSVFFQRPLNLISLLLGIRKFKYACRSDYIQVKKGYKKIEEISIDFLEKNNKRGAWF